ncbi:MAG: ankyrin repeat domain-containing protein [Cyanobacteria bacterium P01_A01_bin.123]
MIQTEWEGVTAPQVYREDTVTERHQLADAARDYSWPRLLELLAENPSWVNTTRLGGQSGFTPLHQAAHGNAPVDVVQKLLELGAWRTLPTSSGERAVDIAQAQGHTNLVPLLEPVYVHTVPAETLQAIQTHFHQVIVGRAKNLLKEAGFRLPELAVLLELPEPKMYCPIPGMYGGFSYWLAETGPNAKLVSESWCRVVGGSGQRHEVTAAGSQLLEEGFV